MIRRLVITGLLVFAVPALLAFATGQSEPPGGGGYKVRAIFDNASFVVPGEDVKVAGVKVGTVDELDVEDKKAAITLSITEPGFSPFHEDAHCSIRPQSLIGERYVECTPGSAASPELEEIPEGEPGAGAVRVELEKTSSPVDIGLINNIMRLPYRQRFAIIINEFGTALAGRGDELNEAIHRANPALRETDRVLAILARQNRVLADLAADSDAVLEPLARRRERIAHFVVAANETGQATAERSADIERTFERLPVFLREFKPTLEDLREVSEEMTPVLADLRTAAPDLNRFIRALGPFSRASTPALVSLGEAAEIGRPALVNSLPLTRDLATFAENANPVGRNLARLAESLDETGGLGHIMDYIFFQMTAINGFDGVSHYLRASLLTNICSTYVVDPVTGCSANFTDTESVRTSSSAGEEDPVLAKQRQALIEPHLAPEPEPAPEGEEDGPSQTNPFDALRELTDPEIAEARQNALENASGAGRTESPAFGEQSPEERALDYLLGND